MISLNKYLSSKCFNIYESEQRKRQTMTNYIQAECTDDNLKKLSLERLVTGTVIHAYKPGNFYEYGYCEFEKINRKKDEWIFTSYTEGINLRDSEWKEVNDEKKYTSAELKQLLENKQKKYTGVCLYIPKRLKDGDFAGVEKYYDRWEEDRYMAYGGDFIVYSFEKLIANIERGYDQWRYVSILHYKGSDEITFRYVLKKDLYVIFKMTENDLEVAFKKSKLDISKIKKDNHYYLERW